LAARRLPAGSPDRRAFSASAGVGQVGAPEGVHVFEVASIKDLLYASRHLALRFSAHACKQRPPVSQRAVLEDVVDRRERVAVIREVSMVHDFDDPRTSVHPARRTATAPAVRTATRRQEEATRGPAGASSWRQGPGTTTTMLALVASRRSTLSPGPTPSGMDAFEAGAIIAGRPGFS